MLLMGHSIKSTQPFNLNEMTTPQLMQFKHESFGRLVELLLNSKS